MRGRVMVISTKIAFANRVQMLAEADIVHFTLLKSMNLPQCTLSYHQTSSQKGLVTDMPYKSGGMSICANHSPLFNFTCQAKSTAPIANLDNGQVSS